MDDWWVLLILPLFVLLIYSGMAVAMNYERSYERVTGERPTRLRQYFTRCDDPAIERSRRRALVLLGTGLFLNFSLALLGIWWRITRGPPQQRQRQRGTGR